MPSDSPKDKPNILLIITDQHRHDYLSCRGQACVDTHAAIRDTVRGHFDALILGDPV